MKSIVRRGRRICVIITQFPKLSIFLTKSQNGNESLGVSADKFAPAHNSRTRLHSVFGVIPLIQSFTYSALYYLELRISFCSFYQESKHCAFVMFNKSASMTKAQKPVESRPPQHSVKVKRKQVARACNSCRINRIKCDDHSPCTNCTTKGVECKRDPVSRAQTLDLAYRLYPHQNVVDLGN